MTASREFAGQPSAHDVERELCRRLVGIVPKKKLQKLLYYCQGWHLALRDEPMFSERIRAWKHGPVVSAHWGASKHGTPVPAPAALTPAMLDTIEYVVSRYGDLTGLQLEDLSHAEPPWRTSWARRERSDEIDHVQLIEWFRADAFFVESGASRRLRGEVRALDHEAFERPLDDDERQVLEMALAARRSDLH